MKQLIRIICSVLAIILALCFSGKGFAAEDTNEQYLDPNFDAGIYFSVFHPDSQQTMYAGGKGIGPLSIHQWKHLTINAVFRYKDENDQIHTEEIGNGASWDSSDPSIISINNGGPKGSCEITTVKDGNASVILSYLYNGKTYKGRVSFNVRKLSIQGNKETLRYAALSMLSYANLGNYIGRTVDEILRPFASGGHINANIGEGNPILISDHYKVFADERDFIATCAGDCVVVATSDVGSFHGVVFSYGSQRIIAYRGTNNFGNFAADVQLGLGLVESDQFSSAINLYNNYATNSIVLTGHSLGGGLANYVSVLTGARAVTFNAPSTMVTAVSNFLAGIEYGRMGQYFKGLNDNLRTDYVNNSDWVGKVGAGDARGGIFTGSSQNLQSGNLDHTVYQTPMIMNNSGLHFKNVVNDHGILRMISYNKTSTSEFVSMSAIVSSTNPDKHSFTWNGGSNEYIFGSVSSDSIIKSAQSDVLEAIVFSGDGNDTITLSGYIFEQVIPGKGNDVIRSIRKENGVGSGNSKYYYYAGHGLDKIYDTCGTDELHVFGHSNIEVIKGSTRGEYHVIDNNGTQLVKLYVGNGTGIFRVYNKNTEIKSIKRENICTGINVCCPVKINIFDNLNNLVETVEDGIIYDGIGDYGSFSTYETEDGYGKSVILTSSDYHLVIEGIGEGTMKYSSDYTYGEETKTKAISSIPVHLGSKYYPAALGDDFLILADLNGDGTIDYQPMSNEIMSVSLPETLTLYLGSTAQLTPACSPAGKTPDFIWSNSNPNVVSISDDGILTAQGIGESTITVTALNGENASASCTVTVPDENLSIEDTTVTGIEKRVAYSGEAYYPEISISFRGMTLIEGKAYYVEYSDEVMPGTSSIVIHGLGPFQGTKTIEYEIYQYIPQTVSEAVDKIVQEMNASGITGEYNKAVWLHNWLIDHANYDYTYSYYSADGVLLRQTGVCQSYTLAYQLLLNKIGVENRVISSSEMDHAWNLVKLDGEWCHVDCTWDDPNEGGMENQFYFGMNDDLIARDHIWNKSSYPSSSSLQNYYPIRNGALVFSNASELDTLLVPLFTAKEESFTILYIGIDPDVTAHSAFEEWYSNNNWKYGIRSFASTYGKFDCTVNEIVYTDPWSEPVNKLSNPVDAPFFSMNSPVGNFNLNNYRGNGVVLIFGREGCLNTRGLLQRLQAELDALHNSGIEVLISVKDAETYSDIQAVKKDYPSFQYCYEQQGLLSAYLEAVDYYNTYDTGGVTYPCVFIINGEGKITYYSTGYVSNLDELVSEAFTTSNLNPLPVPGDNQYHSSETGNANLSDVGDGNVKRALQAACADSIGVFFLTDSSVYYSDSIMMEKWEEDYSLFDSMGLSFVACFEDLSEEDRQAYPHVTFVEYDDNDPFFWDLLGAVNWDFSKQAYYRCCYFLENNGHIADYSNGGTLSIWEKVALLVRDLAYDMAMPTQLQAVDDEAFYGGSFTSVDLGKSSITSIGSMAFASCPNLSFIRLPDCLISIDPNAFLYSDNVVFVCGGNSVAAQFAEANNIPLVCP